MSDFDDTGSGWRRWLLGGRNSLRRIVLTGIGAGVALALVAAVIAGFAGGGFGSLDDDEPTAIAPGAGPPGGGPIEPEPTLAPEEPTATEEVVEPTEAVEPTPVEAEPSATSPPAAPTPTLPPEPTLAE